MCNAMGSSLPGGINKDALIKQYPNHRLTIITWPCQHCKHQNESLFNPYVKIMDGGCVTADCEKCKKTSRIIVNTINCLSCDPKTGCNFQAHRGYVPSFGTIQEDT